MEKQKEIISSINIPLQTLTSESLQALLIAAKRQSQDSTDFWNEVAQVLWGHLQEGLARLDDQLLCSTCFYTVLSLTNKQQEYLNEILEIIRHEIILKDNVMKGNSKTMLAVSIMYGMFQSSFLTVYQEHQILADVLNAFFDLLNLMAYEYSKYTFLVFKTIHSFKKIYGTALQESLFCKTNNIKLLNLVNHNWENPITGVRDLNKGIFYTLISVLDEDTYETILNEINGFYWNKAKYLMLAEIISQSRKDLASNVTKYDWIDGLVCSLHKPGLVSAGADMYFSLLKKIDSEAEWSQMFKKPILHLLNSQSKKAMENFTNYWCLTTFKTYPALIDMLLNELENFPESPIYSNLCIMKQANKLGLLKKNWSSANKSFIEKSILDGLVHNNTQIRIMAFDIVCLSNNKRMPSKIEYEYVLNFLKNNVNSDCTVLRIGMVKSLSDFLTQIHISYLNYLNSIDDKENLQFFCYEFQRLIEYNIKIGGNYQRKITSIRLITVFLSGLKEVPRKKQKQTRKSDKSIIQLLKDEGQWLISDDNFITSLIKLMKDPAEDIRDNVGQLLLEHYSVEVGSTKMANILIEDAFKCISSKYFYEISCGQNMFKLIINLLIAEKLFESTFKTVDDVFNFALKELTTEYQLKRGIVESIEKGKQLHSLLNILYAVLEICYKKKELINISDESINSLVNILKGISNQFTWEQETATSSDFSQMSDMVQDIINNSGYDQYRENDHTKISGLHQIVLNCLWLNVKASCELSSLLIKYQKDDSGTSICNKALEIICHVLETCRHKGAIEAAGAALGQCIQHLTCQPEGTEISKLPMSFLNKKLHELISEASRMASVTRRGAGLSILVHRIVSSDAQRGKPLFHFFMKTILETCNKAEDIPSTLNSVQNIDNEKDLPKAIYVHFLTRIVTDSSLASDMMFYSAELAEIAFGNLTSSYWQIRNAALQLYGALIQKLIGQKKATGTKEETVATVGCDELRTHSPKLWRHIQLQLKNDSFNDRIQYNSDLVPILNMLANIARRYNFSFDATEQEVAVILDSLMSLLDSPIYTVRRLTAKSISNIFTFEEIYDYLYSRGCISENHLHGSLMLIGNCYKIHGSEETYESKFDDLKRKYQSILTARNHSYLSKEVFNEVFFNEDVTRKNFEQTLAELNANYRMPGVFLWANRNIQTYFQNANWNMIPELLKMILIQNEFETYLLILLKKIEIEGNISEKNIQVIFEILLQCSRELNSTVIWQLLYKMVPYINHTHLLLFDISKISKHLENTKVSYKLRFMIPFVARFLTVAVDDRHLQMISKMIAELSDPETADIEMRHIAALANNELGAEIKSFPEAVKITLIKSAVILLQDEDEDVRMLSAKFYAVATKVENSLQPYICLFKTLEHSFLSTILSESGISTLRKELTGYLSKVCSKDIDANNPFANDLSNIYLEVNVFKQLIESL